MHGHGVLMVAAAMVVAACIPVVALVTWLDRRGRLGDSSRRIPFSAYGPIVAGALAGGAAAIHVGLVIEHGILTFGAAPAIASAAVGGVAALGGVAAAFVCSVGAGSAHFSTLDASIGGFLPLGVASLGLAPVHAAWSFPRLWRRAAGAIAGMAVTLAAVAIGILPLLAPPALGPGSPPSRPALSEADVVSLGLEVVLLSVIGLFVLGRPRRLLERLEMRVVDAWVGVGLAVAAVAIFAITALVAGHGLG